MSIVTCSKYTDIPAFEFDKYGNYFTVGRIGSISLKPEDVKTVIWWSKNFEYLLKNWTKYPILDSYDNCFQFTLNPESELEPNIPPLTERLDQLYRLVAQFGADKVYVRFDPVVVYQHGGRGCNNWVSNMDGFETILTCIKNVGINSIRIGRFLDNGKIIRDIEDPLFHEVENSKFSQIEQKCTELKINYKIKGSSSRCICDTSIDIGDRKGCEVWMSVLLVGKRSSTYQKLGVNHF
jgi:hypothetical protein